MKPLVRALDGAAVALAVLAGAVLVWGRLRLGGLAVERAEDLVVVLAIVLGARVALAPVALPRVPPRTLVLGGSVLYVLLLGFVVVTRHVALRTHALDLGYYVQVVWSLAHGHGAHVTLPPMHAWGDHFSPVLYLFVPLGWLPGLAPALLLAQTAIFASGAVAVYAFALRHVRDARVAAGFAGLYLLNPTLHGINIRDVHPAAFAIPLLVAAALAFDGRRSVWCAGALVLALAGREDAAIAGVGLGLWLALARRRWVLGAAVAVVCIALLWVDMNVLMPHFRGEPYPHLVKRYAYLGDSLVEVLANMVLRPWRWLVVVVTPEKGLYLLALVAPLGFLPLLAPRAAAGALPGLAMNLMSADPVLSHHRTQYQAFVLPFLILAAVEGFAALRGSRLASWRVPVAAPLVLGGVIALALTSRTVNDLGVSKWALGPEQHAMHDLLGRVPAAVPVSVNERLVPHLATRREVYVFPAGLERSEWVVEHETVLARTPASGFEPFARAQGWTLLRRASGRGLPQHVRGVVVDEPPAIGLALEHVGGEHRRHGDAPANLRENVLGAGDPGQLAGGDDLHLRQREAHLGGVGEDRLPRRAHGRPADEERPARVDALHVLAVRPHAIHLVDVERLERAIELRVRRLDGAMIAHGQPTTGVSPSPLTTKPSTSRPRQPSLNVRV